jgi:hypothetical protein
MIINTNPKKFQEPTRGNLDWVGNLTKDRVDLGLLFKILVKPPFGLADPHHHHHYHPAGAVRVRRVRRVRRVHLAHLLREAMEIFFIIMAENGWF